MATSLRVSPLCRRCLRTVAAMGVGSQTVARSIQQAPLMRTAILMRGRALPPTPRNLSKGLQVWRPP